MGRQIYDLNIYICINSMTFMQLYTIYTIYKSTHTILLVFIFNTVKT